MKTIKARVFFETTVGCSVDVEVQVPDDTEEYEVDDRIREAGYEGLPSGICAQCSGWSRKWCRDEGEWEIATTKQRVDGKWVDVEVEHEILN